MLKKKKKRNFKERNSGMSFLEVLRASDEDVDDGRRIAEMDIEGMPKIGESALQQGLGLKVCDNCSSEPKAEPRECETYTGGKSQIAVYHELSKSDVRSIILHHVFWALIIGFGFFAILAFFVYIWLYL